MISSDSHFFTNEEGATVLDRLKNLFQNLRPNLFTMIIKKAKKKIYYAF